MDQLTLTDLPADAVEMLKPLSQSDFQFLGVDAYRLRDDERQAELPTDPLEAAKGAHKALRRSVEIKFDDPMDTLSNLLTVLRFAFSAGSDDDLDRRDREALWEVTNLAEDMMAGLKEHDREARERLRAVTHPLNK